MSSPLPVFDGHNDVLLRLYKSTSPDPIADFLNGEEAGHIDLKKAKTGRFAGGLFALYSPSPRAGNTTEPSTGALSRPLPPPLPMDEARASIVGELAMLVRLERASHGAVAICRNVAEITAAMARGALAAVPHIEGADAIDDKLHFLDVLYAAGLRSLGPVWSRPNIFGHGVPFRFPSSPDTGDGLTRVGEDLVRVCDELKILIDLSHINERGFWDVARLSRAPLVATHSNAHALCPSPRNLTDRQLDAIRDTGGMAGLNFATGFLRPDGQMRADTDIALMVQQLDYLLEKLGEDHVGLGSDFDGAMVPAAIGSAAGLPVLFDALRARGYSDALLRKIASQNWLALLARSIG